MERLASSTHCAAATTRPVVAARHSSAWHVGSVARAVSQKTRPTLRAFNNEPGTSNTVSVSTSEDSSPSPSTSTSTSSSSSSIEHSSSPEHLLLKSLEAEVDAEGDDGGSRKGALFAGLGLLGGLALLVGGGYVFRGPIGHFLEFFINAVDEWGPLGYVAYAAVYTGLEVLAVPAIPLTMTAGAIFGPLAGTAVVSVSGTLAATIAFLIARYAARDKVAAFARRNKRFAAVDRAISRSGFKFVALLRLSPLLPLAVSNYLYGLTSVGLGPYILGSWLGMLPGTYAYVTAGHVGKAVLTEGEGAIGVDNWQIALALGATVLALGFVGQLAKKAVEEADGEALREEAAAAAAASAATAATSKRGGGAEEGVEAGAAANGVGGVNGVGGANGVGKRQS